MFVFVFHLNVGELIVINYAFQICYGLTESSPVTFQTSPEDPLEQRVSTVGKAHPHTEVHATCHILQLLIK